MPEEVLEYVVPAKIFTIKVYVDPSWPDELGMELAKGFENALDGVLAAICRGVELVDGSDGTLICLHCIENEQDEYMVEW